MDDRLQSLSQAGVHVGGVAYTTTLVGIHFERRGEGAPFMRVFVTDGLPGGAAEWFEGPAEGCRFNFTSVSGRARIEGRNDPFHTHGTVTLPDGPRHVFATRPAGDGAGVFEVTVGADGAWAGRSLEGSTLEADQQGATIDGFVRSNTGDGRSLRAYVSDGESEPAGDIEWVTAPNGEVADLFGADLTKSYEYGVEGSLPGTYVAFAAPRGRFLIGCNGDVRGGSTGVNIIGLDKQC